MSDGEDALPPAFQRRNHYPELAWFSDATRAGDWPAIAAGFQRLDSWAAASVASSRVGDVPGAEVFLRQVVAREPSALSATLLGSALISAGWRIRTSKAAEHVSREQFEALHEHLREAEQALMGVTARDPRAVMAWEDRLTTAMGLQLGLAEARRRYDRLARIEPHHYIAQSALTQQLCPKWGGSWEALFQFVRERAAAAPPGGLHGALVATAHLEYWARADGEEADASLKRAQPEVWAAAQRSVLHPSFRPEPGWIAAFNTFAAFFAFGGAADPAAVFFRGLGPHASTTWWDYLGDGVEMFHAYRTGALGGPR